MDPAVSCLSTVFSGLHIHLLPFSSLKASCLLLPQDLCTYLFGCLNVLLLPAPVQSVLPSELSSVIASLMKSCPTSLTASCYHLPLLHSPLHDCSSALTCSWVINKHLPNKQADKSFPPGRILSLTTHSYFCLFSRSS